MKTIKLGEPFSIEWDESNDSYGVTLEWLVKAGFMQVNILEVDGDLTKQHMVVQVPTILLALKLFQFLLINGYER